MKNIPIPSAECKLALHVNLFGFALGAQYEIP